VTPWALISPARLAGSGLLRTQSDARLVDLVRAGNDRAFDAIVLRYHRPLLRHCRRLLPAARAEDAVQTSFLRALEAIRANQRELQLSAWLHRIAHNTAIDALRRLDSDWEELGEHIDGVEPTHAAAERRARFHSVVAGMGALPERQRRALVLRELEGRSYEEIATTLGVTGAGVRQLLNRARNAMRAGASALVPPALVGRLAGSQTGVRIAELADPPGTSALLAKGTAAVAASAVTLLAVTSGPPGDRHAVPHAEAKTKPPAAESRPDPGGRPGAPPTTAQPELERRRSGASGRARPKPNGDRQSRSQVRQAFGRIAADPGGGATPERLDGGDAPAPVPRRRVASYGSGEAKGDDDDDAPGGSLSSRATAVPDGDDDAGAGDDDEGDDDAMMAGSPQPDDDGGGDADDDDAVSVTQVAEGLPGAEEEDDDEADELD
jgi:RNA polymerase sigma factor (sigma-70 family)